MAFADELNSNREKPEDPLAADVVVEQQFIKDASSGFLEVSNTSNLEETEEILHFEGAVTTEPALPEKDTRITVWLFKPDEYPREVKLAQARNLIKEDHNFVWIDLSNYSAGTLQEVAAILALHPVSMKAALSAWQRPRYDKFRNHFFVTATVAHLDAEVRRVYAGELDLFVGNNFLVSAHKLPLPFAKKILDRARQSPELVKLDSAFMLYIILDELLEYYEELCDHVEDENEKMEQRALKDTSDSFLSDLLQHKRYIFALSRLADQHRKVFAALTRADAPFSSSEEMQPYFQDLESHFERLLDTLNPAKEAVNGAFEIYVSHVAHRTNQIIKTLTMVSTILLPATIIISLFGTNIVGVSVSGFLEFALMIIIILITTAAILYTFRRRGWI